MSDHVLLTAREAYAAALESNTLGQNFILLDETDSTNTRIRELESDDLAAHTAVSALRQTAGRGRLGRSWESEGGGLYLSFGVVTDPQNFAKLPLMAAGAVIAALDEAGIRDAGIKWPNDIIASNKKICGILCQAWGRRAAVGIGVNISQTADEFARADLPNAASLAMLGYTVDRWTLAARILTHADRIWAKIESGAFSQVLDDYRRRCISIGRDLIAIAPDREIHGVGTDVDEEGRLVLKTADGFYHVESGEVKLRSTHGYI